MAQIFAFGHQKFVGKDTIIKFMIDILRPKMRASRIVKRGFADRVYDVCYLLYKWAGMQTRAYYEDHPYAKANLLKNGKTVRQLLIEVGTPVMRAYDEQVWINAALSDDDFDILLINDCRFPNEFEAVKNLGGTTIRVTRPGLEAPTDVADTALNGYEEQWDEHIENNGDLNALYDAAVSLIAKYVKLP